MSLFRGVTGYAEGQQWTREHRTSALDFESRLTAKEENRVNNPKGKESGSRKIMRGGSGEEYLLYSTSALRDIYTSNQLYEYTFHYSSIYPLD